jgi:hypothetical protein
MADKRTDQLDAAGSLAGTEPVPVFQDGTTKRSTPAAFLAYIRALLTDTDVPAGITTEAGTSRVMENADAGRYIRFTSDSAKTATFGTGVNVVGQEFHIRNVGANDLTLTPSSTTLNAPAGGTLVVPPSGTVTVKQVGATEFDVFGTTTAA